MLKPDVFTISRNMHKLSLQNPATALPLDLAHQPCPLGYKHALLTASPNTHAWPKFARSVREKGKNSYSLAGICMKKGMGICTCCFARSCNSVNASASLKARHQPLLPYFLAMPIKLS